MDSGDPFEAHIHRKYYNDALEEGVTRFISCIF